MNGGEPMMLSYLMVRRPRATGDDEAGSATGAAPDLVASAPDRSGPDDPPTR